MCGPYPRSPEGEKIEWGTVQHNPVKGFFLHWLFPMGGVDFWLKIYPVLDTVGPVCGGFTSSKGTDHG
jgi:hypothetical protein